MGVVWDLSAEYAAYMRARALVECSFAQQRPEQHEELRHLRQDQDRSAAVSPATAAASACRRRRAKRVREATTTAGATASVASATACSNSASHSVEPLHNNKRARVLLRSSSSPSSCALVAAVATELQAADTDMDIVCDA
jgi:predicted neuraminidase